jgi:Xaa-Pro aminopeptidase
MKDIRRTTYASKVVEPSLSLFFSGRAPQRSADQNYLFSVNRNFYYLTGIDQQHVVLLIAKGAHKTDSYLFIEPIDPVKALWDGAGLSFEEAAEIAQIDVKNVKPIDTLNLFISQLLSTNRRALYGQVETIYLDLERQSDTSSQTPAQLFAQYLQKDYPFVSIKTNQMILAEQRMIKDQSEIDTIRKAISITDEGLSRIMKHLAPGKTEFGMQAEYNYVLNYHRTTPSFDTIAASGKNATILHYIENKDEIKDHTLLLLDLGVELDHYCSDITRVFPANGTFTERQKAVYEVVLEANKKTIEWLKPGVTLKEFNDFGKSILIEGAKKLGLIKEDSEIDKYYYHGLGHYLGLDVHDVGNYSLPIPEGALITVEPGLYIAEESIGIRIEDDVVVTKDGAINLSKQIIKEVKDIEAFMKK